MYTECILTDIRLEHQPNLNNTTHTKGGQNKKK